MRVSAWGRRPPRGSPLQLVAVLAVIVVVAVVAGLLQPQASLTGRAVGIDGDTLKLGSARLRLIGLDAPELEQDCTDKAGKAWDCGRMAQAFVRYALSRGEATCQLGDKDRYGRRLARCNVDGADLGNSIVSAGWAVAEPEYVLDEIGARAAGRGIWSGTFEAPADWRRDHGAEPNFWDWLRGWFD